MKAKSYSTNLNKALQNIVKEAEAAYGISRVADHNLTYNDLFADQFLTVTLIRHGVPYSFFEDVSRLAPISESEWVDILGISLKTLQRYQKGQKDFKSIQSQKILEVLEVTLSGLEVFGTASAFQRWLHTSNLALGSLTPLDLIKDSYGKALVLTELIHIDQGIFV